MTNRNSMKTLKFKNIASALLLTVVALFITGCSGDDNKEPVNNSKIVGVWTKTKEESKEGTAAWKETTEDCDLDDTEEFKADGDWALYPGTVTCGSASVINGSWSLRANDTKVVFTYDGFDDEFESTIVELTETKMVLTHSSGDVNDTQYRDTYVKK